LLGRARVIPGFSRPPFRVAVFAGQGPVPHHRRGFLETLQAVSGSCGQPPGDTVSTQLPPTVSSVRSQPEPAETLATAAATPAGRAAPAQVHAQGSALAPHPGCSQSGQPDRVVTAVAADQCPGRPRFITLPPGSVGSVILDEFPKVANAAKVLPPSSHGVEHFIATKGPPIASKFWRLDAEKLQAAKAEFEQLEREGIMQRSTSPWASPLHMVMKKDGLWRPCGDFRRLNLVTEPDTYPLPNMLDFSARVAGCKVFSKIDLRKGYYQIPYLCIRLTSGKQPSAHRSGCSSFAACLSGCATRATPSSA
jgi:hypothetical protein